MKPRKNPTNEQMLRRLKELPESTRDPRFRKDAYMTLRASGYSHSYAKRAFRDILPELRRFERDSNANDYDIDPEDIIVPINIITLNVVIRPTLSQEIADTIGPRDVEYTIWDENLQGFGLRVRASGYKSYIYLYRNNTGRLSKKTLGNSKKISLEDAKDRARIVRDQLVADDPNWQSEDYELNSLTCRAAKEAVSDGYPTVTPDAWINEELDVEL